jgi:hypothetical protein
MDERPYARLTVAGMRALLGKRGGNRAQIRAGLILELTQHRDANAAKRLLEELTAERSGKTPPSRVGRGDCKKARTTPDAPHTERTPIASVDPEPVIQLAEEPDDVQDRIMSAPSGERQLVIAPPGTGKTHVACQRVVSLLSRGVEPHRIWMISFTRAAIAELRNRIRGLGAENERLRHVVVATLDSRAWQLLNGYSEEGASLLGGHALSIAQAAAMLENPSQELSDRLSEIECLIVDEAQDLVGDRARFVEHLIAALPAEAGVTVLGDPAQAIYDFAEQEERPEQSPIPLLERLARAWQDTASTYQLSYVYRTPSRTLRNLFVRERSKMLRLSEKAAYDGMYQSIETHRDELRESSVAIDLKEDELALHRRRIDALTHFSYYAQQRSGARLRMSGFPKAIHPWVAIMFAALDAEWIPRTMFDDAWSMNFTTSEPSLPSCDEAWGALYALDRDRHRTRGICRASIREVLAMGAAPDRLMVPEYGYHGPIFGTVHASKGREADTVRLALPVANAKAESDWDEEARILFVGATRARHRLIVARETSRPAYSNDGRDFRRLRGAQGLQVEVGRDGDLDEISPVTGPDAFGHDVTAAQAFLHQYRYAHQPVSISWVRTRYVIRVGSGETSLGALRATFGKDLMSMARRALKSGSRGFPAKLLHAYSLGARTVVVSRTDQKVIDRAAPAFAQSGFWLAPMIVGLSSVYYYPAGRQ